jgi:hypothetical protein
MIVTMKNEKFFFSIIMFAICILFAFTACSKGGNNNENEQTTSETTVTDISEIPISVPETPDKIRVYENGNANVKLFPDGTFIANLFHNSKITGTYSEITDGVEIAIFFDYNGFLTNEDEINTFELTGHMSVVGGILDNVLKIPVDWDDGHGHGLDFDYKEYPVVFADPNGQQIVLNADNTFTAKFKNDVTVLGYYTPRKSIITFVPGSPVSNRDGDIVGSFLVAEITGGEEDDDDETGETSETETTEVLQGNEETTADNDNGGGQDEAADAKTEITLKLPEIWFEASGGSAFALQ